MVNKCYMFVSPFLIAYTFLAPATLSICIILISIMINSSQLLNVVLFSILLYVILSLIIGILYRNAFHLIKIDSKGIYSKFRFFSWEQISTIKLMEVKLFEYSLIKTKQLTFIAIGGYKNDTFITTSFSKAILIPLNKKTRSLIISYNSEEKSPIIELVS